MGDRKVEDAGQVAQAGGPKMLQVKNRESVRPGGGGVFAAVNNSCGVIWIEGREVVVERMVSLQLSEDPAHVRVAGVRVDVSELFGEISGYGCVFSAGLCATVRG